MTVAANNPINSYVGNSGASSYPFTFPVFLSSQILVTVTSPAAVTTILGLGTDYSVVGLNPSGDPASTGSISLINASQAWLTAGNLTTGWTLTIQSNFPYSQTTSYRNQGDFYRASLENSLDNIEYQIQQLSMYILSIATGGGATIVQPVIILLDTVNGNSYQLLMVNGVLSTQQVS